MIEGILGRKIGMSRFFDQEGNSIGTTLIECGPCYVSAAPEAGRLQIAFEQVKEKSLSLAETGHLKKSSLPPMRHLKEVRWLGDDQSRPSVGDRITADVFKEGERIDIRGISKGKGFTGVVKRWGFSGGRKTHGGTVHRGPGSIGAGSDPSRVWPRLKMAGRSGGAAITAFNLEILKIDSQTNIIAVKGSVPGPNRAVIFLRRTLKIKAQKNLK